MRKLTAKDVEFHISIEQEDEPVHGHFATGEDELDRQLEADIIAELNRGNVEAWCFIRVTASWRGHTGADSLGCCSHLPREGQPSLAKQVEQTIEYHGMREQALDDLNNQLGRHGR